VVSIAEPEPEPDGVQAADAGSAKPEPDNGHATDSKNTDNTTSAESTVATAEGAAGVDGATATGGDASEADGSSPKAKQMQAAEATDDRHDGADPSSEAIQRSAAVSSGMPSPLYPRPGLNSSRSVNALPGPGIFPHGEHLPGTEFAPRGRNYPARGQFRGSASRGPGTNGGGYHGGRAAGMLGLNGANPLPPFGSPTTRNFNSPTNATSCRTDMTGAAAATEPKGLGVEGAPTAPKALREGLPNTSVKQRGFAVMGRGGPPTSSEARRLVYSLSLCIMGSGEFSVFFHGVGPVYRHFIWA
jgi:hypothetical protein